METTNLVHNLRVSGGNVQVGNQYYTDANVGSWILQHASKTKLPERPESSFPKRLVHWLYRNELFQRCFQKTGHTLILQGRLGVGKTTTILGILDLLQQTPTPDKYSHEPDEKLQSPAATTSERIQTRHEESHRKTWPKSTLKFGTATTDAAPQDYKVDEQVRREPVVASIFFNTDNYDQHHPASVLMLLLQQLVIETNDFEHAQNLFAKYRNWAMPKPEEVVTTIVSLLKDKHTCIILDALDECNPDYLANILHYLRNIQVESKVGLVMTNRIGTTTWQKHFRDATKLTLYTDNNDIDEYLDDMLSELWTDHKECLWAQEQTVRDFVKSTIADASGNIFLLVQLNFLFISAAITNNDVEADLDTIRKMAFRSNISHISSTDDYNDNEELYLNTVLSNAFRRNINRAIESRDDLNWRRTGPNWRTRTMVVLVLAFLRDAVRPLSVAELVKLLQIQSNARGGYSKRGAISWESIEACCQGLIEKDKLGNVGFLHVSLGTYLSGGEGVELVPSASEELGKRCVSYMTTSACFQDICHDQKSLEERLNSPEFLEYAARYWTIHLKFHKPTTGSDQLKPGSFYALARELLRMNNRVEAAHQISFFPDLILQNSLRSRLQGAKLKPAFLTITQYEDSEVFDPFTPNRMSGLHIACKYELDVLLQHLVAGQSPESLDSQNFEGQTPLHIAVTKGNLSCVKILVEAGANPLKPNVNGVTPFHISGNDTSIFMFLRENCGAVDINAQTSPLHRTRRSVTLPIDERGNIPVMRSSILTTTYIASKRTILHTAARNGNLKILKNLLNVSGIDLNVQDADGQTPLHKAAKKGQLPCVRELVQAGVDPSQRVGCRPDGNPVSADAMKLPKYRSTPLHLACQYERSHGVIQYLLDILPDMVNDADGRGQRPLHLAASFDCVSNVQLILVRQDVDVNAKDCDGKTPLHIAIDSDTYQALDLLLKKDQIELNARDNHNYTPLGIAAQLGKASVIEKLLALPTINPNEMCGTGIPTLFLAAQAASNEPEVGHKAFRLLWEHRNTDRNIQDHEGRGLIEFTKNLQNHSEILEVIQGSNNNL